MKPKSFLFIAVVALALVVRAGAGIAQGLRPDGPHAPQAALGTAFTYQGQLNSSGSPYSGACDFEFELYGDASAGVQIGTTFTASSVSVAEGRFTTQLDFGGNTFDGSARWLAIGVRCPAGSGSYTDLLPRQPLTATPYALTALKTAYANVLVVAKSGGHYPTISDALASITDNSAANRYLVWVAPGTYTETVTMKEYVDIEGSGELTTKITHRGDSNPYTGTVVGANNAELRFLTVENTGGYEWAIAIYNGGTSPRLTHVTATASSSGGWGEVIGVSNSSGSPTMTNVTATASGLDTNYGVYNYTSSPTMSNVIATASGGFGNCGVFNLTSSPAMSNVTATATGGTENYGVLNSSSSPTMASVIATATGGTNNYGVFNASASSPTMTNVTATASGGTSNQGMRNDSASPTIQNSTISGSGGASNYGIFNTAASGSYTVLVNNSQIMGSVGTVRNDAEFTTHIGASELEGGAVFPNGGTASCAGVYDEAYTFYTNTCP